MSITNRYVKRSRISEAKFREFVRYFSLDLDAYKIATLTGLNRNTVNRYLKLIRKRIAEFCEQTSPGQGEIEINESSFGARRVIWSYAKRRLMKFHGVPRSTFYFHLKECEFRFNYRSENIYRVLLELLIKKPAQLVSSL